jgi:Ca2+-binding EF-hand superfamily protein
MRKLFQFSSALLRCGIHLFIGSLLAGAVALKAQETAKVERVSGGVSFSTGGHGEGGLFINGAEIGSLLLKMSDLDQDGKATLIELKAVATACFKLWDTNADGTISQGELAAAAREFFPAPPPGAMRGIRVINGVEVEVPPGELPTPDGQLCKHLLAGADSNKDGLLSLQEINDFLEKSFGGWDQDGNGSLDTKELGMAFGQLTIPDGAVTAVVH